MKLKELLSKRPKRVKLTLQSENKSDMSDLCIPKEKEMYLDDDQVKMIWELASLSTSDGRIEDAVSHTYQQNEEPTYYYYCGPDDDKNSPEYENCLLYESDMHHHYYPWRKSLYNRKHHFISFIQNYVTWDQGRKIMSEYEHSVCDFIMTEIKPTSPDELLCAMKLCKLSNVYRFHNFIFWQYHHRQKNSKCLSDFTDIAKIVQVYESFENYFYRNGCFGRKNFLSMRFVLGRILILLGLVSNESKLDIDLQRPKGKSQHTFHLTVWNSFIDEINIK